MEEKKFTKNSNNPNYIFETTRQDAQLAQILEHAYDMRGDEIRYTHMKYGEVHSHILFTDVCDIHAGGQGWEGERVKLALENVAKANNSIMVIGGDSIDNANRLGATNSNASRVRPGSQYQIVKELLGKDGIITKVVAIVGGNHDSNNGKRNIDSDISPANIIAESLNIPYVPTMLIQSLPILNDKLDIQYMNIAVIHDAGNIDNAKRLIQLVYNDTGILLDAVFVEHLHNSMEGIFPIDNIRVYDKNGYSLGDKAHQAYIGMGYSFQNADTSYGAQKMFNNKTNLKACDLSWRRNPYSTKENELFEPKYIACVNSFDVLDEKKCEPSLMMEMYLKEHQKINTTNLKNKIAEWPIEKIIAMSTNAPEKMKKSINEFAFKQKQKRILQEKKDNNKKNKIMTEEESAKDLEIVTPKEDEVSKE